MTAKTNHNRLLTKIVIDRLRPFNVCQKGNSRTFLYDKGWYTIVIEFQPSSYSKGTYLNIGVDLNFYPRDNFAYIICYRERGFEILKDEEQYSTLIDRLCDIIIKRINEFDKQFKDFKTALKTLQKENNEDSWILYSRGILHSLKCDYLKSQNILQKISSEKCEFDWQIDRKRIIDKIISWLGDESTYLTKIGSLIDETRKLKGLPSFNLDIIIKK